MSKPMQSSVSVIPSCDGVKKKEQCEHHAECMKWIQRLLDGDTTPEQAQHIQANIGKCIPCEKGFALENAIKDALQFRIEKKNVPTNLIEVIRQKINIF